MAYRYKRGGFRRRRYYNNFRSYGRRAGGYARRTYNRSKGFYSKNKKLVKWLSIALLILGALALFAPKYINQFKSKLGILKTPIA